MCRLLDTGIHLANFLLDAKLNIHITDFKGTGEQIRYRESFLFVNKCGWAKNGDLEQVCNKERSVIQEGESGVYAFKRVAAGAHLPTPWIYEPAKRPDDRADYCLDCSFLP